METCVRSATPTNFLRPLEGRPPSPSQNTEALREETGVSSREETGVSSRARRRVFTGTYPWRGNVTLHISFLLLGFDVAMPMLTHRGRGRRGPHCWRRRRAGCWEHRWCSTRCCRRPASRRCRIRRLRTGGANKKCLDYQRLHRRDSADTTFAYYPPPCSWFTRSCRHVYYSWTQNPATAALSVNTRASTSIRQSAPGCSRAGSRHRRRCRWNRLCRRHRCCCRFRPKARKALRRRTTAAKNKGWRRENFRRNNATPRLAWQNENLLQKRIHRRPKFRPG